MADAYKCDNCKEFFDGEAYFNLYDRSLPEFGSVGDFELCSWTCVSEFAAKQKNER